MLKLIFIIVTINLVSCKEQTINKHQVVFDRIEFVYNLKETIEEDVWKTFNNKEFDVPLIYYTDTASFIANPTEKFLAIFKSKLVYEVGKLKIFKTEKLLDSVPFHMETGMTLGDTTDEYNYHSPFMKCSSFEITNKTIPEVSTTEQWTTMIMHEYFHGFQYKHQAYLGYCENEIVQIQPDSLKSIYNSNAWFKEKIDFENSLLLQAIIEKDSIKTNIIIDSFFKVRHERRRLTKQNLNFDIDNYEKCYETMEGTARYVEYSLYKKYSTRSGDDKLSKSDTSFKSFNQYKNYNIENEKWLYMTSKTIYFYAIGFNMANLLDKLKTDYKSKLFKQGGLSLEEILKTR